MITSYIWKTNMSIILNIFYKEGQNNLNTEFPTEVNCRMCVFKYVFSP